LAAQYGILQRINVAAFFGVTELTMSQGPLIRPEVSGIRMFKFIAFLYGMASY
jgi:hypothetical protein